MGLEDDLTTLRSAIDGDERLNDELRAAIARLAESTDDRALHLLVEAFTWSVYTSWTELKDALVASKHSDASRYLASQFQTWWDADETLCISHAAPVLARRFSTEALPTLREMSEIAADDSIVLRALLVARIALGDVEAMEPARREFLSGRSHQGTDAYPEMVMELASAEAFYDTFAEIVRRYQAGDNDLSDAAAKIAFQVTDRPYRYEGRKRVLLPWPERDPRWAELGVEILAQRPRPKLIPYAEKLLRVPHPNQVKQIGRETDPHDRLLDDLPETLLQMHREGGWALYERHGVKWIAARSLMMADLDALFDAWGDRARSIRGLSMRGRQLVTAAFEKLFGWQRLERFTHFDFSYMPMKAADMHALIDSQGMHDAIYLNVRSIAAKKPPLGRLGSWKSLRALVLGSGGDYGPQYGLSTLMELAEGRPALDRLELHDFRFERSMASFGDTDLAGELGELRIAGWYRMGNDASALLHRIASHGGRLRRLELPGCFRNLGPGDWNEHGSTSLESLSAIDLAGGATSDLFPGLANAWFIPQLRELGLGRTYVYQDRFAPMLEIEMPELRRLSLRDVEGLDRALFERIVDAPLARHLEYLDVGGATDLRTDDARVAPPHVRRAMRAAGWP